MLMSDVRESMKFFLKTTCFVCCLLLVSSTSFANDGSLIAKLANDVKPLNIGAKIPKVTLYTSDGDPLALRKITYKRPAVYYFYQGNWSPSCSRQLGQLRDIADELDNLGFQLIGITPDSPYKLRRTQKKKKLNYLLLSDYHFEAARKFGVAYKLSNREQRIIRKKYGAELRIIEGEDGFTLPVPAFFIVNNKGIVQFQYVNPDVHHQLDTRFLIQATKMVANQR